MKSDRSFELKVGDYIAFPDIHVPSQHLGSGKKIKDKIAYRIEKTLSSKDSF